MIKRVVKKFVALFVMLAMIASAFPAYTAIANAPIPINRNSSIPTPEIRIEDHKLYFDIFDTVQILEGFRGERNFFGYEIFPHISIALYINGEERGSLPLTVFYPHLGERRFVGTRQIDLSKLRFYSQINTIQIRTIYSGYRSYTNGFAFDSIGMTELSNAVQYEPSINNVARDANQLTLSLYNPWWGGVSVTTHDNFYYDGVRRAGVHDFGYFNRTIEANVWVLLEIGLDTFSLFDARFIGLEVISDGEVHLINRPSDAGAYTVYQFLMPNADVYIRAIFSGNENYKPPTRSEREHIYGVTTGIYIEGNVLRWNSMHNPYTYRWYGAMHYSIEMFHNDYGMVQTLTSSNYFDLMSFVQGDDFANNLRGITSLNDPSLQGSIWGVTISLACSWTSPDYFLLWTIPHNELQSGYQENIATQTTPRQDTQGSDEHSLSDDTSDCSDSIGVLVGNQRISFADQHPIVIDGRTLVPVRGVFEALGFDVFWEDWSSTVVLTSSTHQVRITVGQSTFYTNGVAHELDVPAQIIGGRTMIPLRAPLESVGLEIGWDEVAQAVLIVKD